MKSIISIYNGSPQKNGNTAFSTHYIFEQIKRKGYAEVRYFNISDYKIDACYGCRKCMELKHCTNQKDDFEFLFNTVKESTISVWGVPVYWFSPPGITKNFIDRTHGYFACKPMLTEQKTFLLNIATDSGFSTNERVMRSWLEYYGANVKETLNIYATEPNDIKTNTSKIEQLDKYIEQILFEL